MRLPIPYPVLTLVLLATWLPAGEPAPTLAVVEKAALNDWVDAVGTVRAARSARLGPQLTGRVETVLVEVGAQVAAGQELVRLDTTSLDLEVAARRAELAAAQSRLATSRQAVITVAAELAAAEATLADAERTLGRMTNLFGNPGGDTPAIPLSRLDEARTRRDTLAAGLAAGRSRLAETRNRSLEAASAVAVVRSSLRLSEDRRRQAVICAPFAGVVVRRLVDPGVIAAATPPTDLLELAEVDPLYLEWSLPQDRVSALQPGLEVVVQGAGVPDGRAVAKIQLVFPTIDEATRTIRLRAVLNDPGRRWRPGLLVGVRTPAGRLAETLVIPLAAVQDGRVRVAGQGQRVVRLGAVDGERVQVLDGLSLGDRVELAPARGDGKP